MAKKSGFFRKFFKLIFSLAGLAVGVLAVILMVLPFVGATISGEVMGQTATGIVALSGFALAFGGTPIAEMTVNGETVDLIPDDVLDSLPTEAETGITVAFVLLAVGVVLALLYVLFSWGKKNTTIKLGLGVCATLVLLVGGILCFFAPNFAELESSTEEIMGMTFKQGLLYGGILTGVFGIASGALMGIASLLGPRAE